MQCAKCAAELKGAGKFCTECGAPVQMGVDPFASTLKPHRPVAAPTEPARAVSPLASSSFEFSEEARELVLSRVEVAPTEHPPSMPAGGAAASAPPKGTVQMHARAAPAGASQPSVPQPSAPQPSAPQPSAPQPVRGASARPPSSPLPSGGALTPGAAVHVRWANGQRYPGTVWQVHGTQVLVAFGDGQRHWVERSYVEGG